jgi:hypothetical protein
MPDRQRLGGDPTIVTGRDGLAIVVARARDRRVWVLPQVAGGWGSWRRVDDTAAFTDPVAALDAAGRLVIVTTGNTGRPIASVADAHGVPQGFQQIAAADFACAGRAALVLANDRLYLAVRRQLDLGRREPGLQDGGIHLLARESAGEFVGVRNLGGQVASDPSLAVDLDNRIEALTRVHHDLVQLVWETRSDEWWAGRSTLRVHLSPDVVREIVRDHHLDLRADQLLHERIPDAVAMRTRAGLIAKLRQRAATHPALAGKLAKVHELKIEDLRRLLDEK